jgi:Williams-Beuren syndrome DDT (WSD), D-TOX E motif
MYTPMDINDLLDARPSPPRAPPPRPHPPARVYHAPLYHQAALAHHVSPPPPRQLQPIMQPYYYPPAAHAQMYPVDDLAAHQSYPNYHPHAHHHYPSQIHHAPPPFPPPPPPPPPRPPRAPQDAACAQCAAGVAHAHAHAHIQYAPYAPPPVRRPRASSPEGYAAAAPLLPEPPAPPPVPRGAGPVKRRVRSAGAAKAAAGAAANDAARPAFPEVAFVAGLPPSVVGDMLQVWDFVGNFARTLRVGTSVSLRALERVVAGGEGGDGEPGLLDVLVVRLVYTIIDDDTLAEELDFDEDMVTSLRDIKPRRRAGAAARDAVFSALPSLLTYEPDEVDADDRELAEIVGTLRGAPGAFYSACSPAERVRILRELVEYASMSDALLACIQDSVEHAAEERKKMREEVVANRRRQEQQLKSLREELREYRIKHGLIVVDVDGGGDEGGKGGNGVSPTAVKEKGSGGSEEDGIANAYAEDIRSNWKDVDGGSRQMKLEQARQEREAERGRRDVERGAEAIQAKIDKLRLSLKALRSVRLRKARESVRKGEAQTGGGHGVVAAASASTAKAVAKAAKAAGSIVTTGKDGGGSAAAKADEGGDAGGAPQAPLVELDSESDPVRTYPLGSDRAGRGYWYFRDVPSRLWIEDPLTGEWGYLNTTAGVAQLVEHLSPRQAGEPALAAALRRIQPALEAGFAKAARRRAARDAGLPPASEDSDVDDGLRGRGASAGSSDENEESDGDGKDDGKADEAGDAREDASDGDGNKDDDGDARVEGEVTRDLNGRHKAAALPARTSRRKRPVPTPLLEASTGPATRRRRQMEADADADADAAPGAARRSSRTTRGRGRARAVPAVK